MKSNQQAYEFLTKENNFDTTVSLIESFNEVKQSLISEFWENLFEEIKKSNTLEKWNFWLENFDIVESSASVNICHSNDKDKSVIYSISIEKGRKLVYS